MPPPSPLPAKAEAKPNPLAPLVCGRCGKRNPATAVYCFGCGGVVSVEEARKLEHAREMEDHAQLAIMQDPRMAALVQKAAGTRSEGSTMFNFVAGYSF